MVEKKIGKIQNIKFGHGGYQDAAIGFTFSLGGPGWGVETFWGEWATEWRSDCKWTPETRNQNLGEIVMRVQALLRDAGKRYLSELKDVPIEAEFNDNVLIDWRILTEVL